VRKARERLLVISHTNVSVHNQLVFAGLAERGWDVHCVLPDRWVDIYRVKPFRPSVLPELAANAIFVPVLFAGSRQRHLYRINAARLVRRVAPDVAFMEQEPFSLPAAQWGAALAAGSVPFGLHSTENLDRRFQLPARLIRRALFPRASFVAARSARAAALARRWGAREPVRFVPHTVPEWEPRASRPRDDELVIGFVGRLVDEKGVRDLLAAVKGLSIPARMVVVGDGPLRAWVEGHDAPAIDVQPGLTTESMRDLYASMDVLVVPSRSTDKWEEQYGRVLIEAQLCGVPVIGSSSGEIPWVVASTRGGWIFPEGDVDALRAAIEHVAEDREGAARVGADGARAAQRLFSTAHAVEALDELLHDAMRRSPSDQASTAAPG